MARTKPPLKLRRGTQAEVLAAFASAPADFALGEPIFATDTGKLYIKNAAGTLDEISGSGSTNIDLSDIDAGSMVKVNPSQDGFVAAAGGDVPPHTHPVANLQAGSAETGDVVKFDGTNWVAGAITVSGDTYNSQAFSDAVERELLVNLPTDGGVLDIAQQSTLVELGDEIDTIAAAVAALEAAPDGVDLTGFSDGDVLMVEAGSGGNTLAAAVAGTDYIAPGDITKLRAVFAESDLPSTAGTTTGYLKWTYASGNGTWSVDPISVTAPDFINGGGANADSGE